MHEPVRAQRAIREDVREGRAAPLLQVKVHVVREQGRDGRDGLRLYRTPCKSDIHASD